MTGLLDPEPRTPAIPGTSIHVIPGDNREIIINRPSLQSIPLRLGLGAVTAFFWGVWLVFWRPVVLVVSRASGIPNTSEFFALGDGFRAFLHVLPWYSLVVLLTGGALIGWANLNWARFSNKERRSSRPPVTRAALASHFQVSEESIPVHIGNNRIEISYDESGKIMTMNSSRATPGGLDA